ncbi:hypothetical protein ABMA57_00020 [Saccharospirillum sp. HFRX-1]|uniref:hypothetical protein n=1 Tax=unclassified Saccharospirillum TaxID=2633430 RepID=UPI0037175415
MTKFNRSNFSSVDYIWVDGGRYAARVRSKVRVLSLPDEPQIEDYPSWTFDGSLTDQGGNENLHLVPVRQYVNPFKGGRNYLVLCEVNDATGYAHATSHRSGLRLLLDNIRLIAHQPWVGFVQHYSLVADEAGNGEPTLDEDLQSQTRARIAEAHANACLDAGLHLHSWHLSSHEDHWVFQLGVRDDSDQHDPLEVADDLWVARYLLEQIAQQDHQSVVYDSLNAPAPLSISISTLKTRSEVGGITEIQRIISVLENLEIVDRGSNEFKRQFYRSEDLNPGYTSRHSAFRIPASVVMERSGYVVDQRPRAKADPYRIAQYLLGSLLVSEVSSDRRARMQRSSEVGV